MTSVASTRASVEMLRKLIAFPTVSRDSNLELIHFVRDFLEPYDAEFRLTHDDDRRKANLFATLGPRGAPGIVLSGHTDVVFSLDRIPLVPNSPSPFTTYTKQVTE